MNNSNLTRHGYFLIKIRKCINLYLWGETVEDLFKYDSKDNYPESKGWKVVPYFKSPDRKEYLEIDGKMVRIA